MISAEFFEEYPLFRKLHLQAKVDDKLHPPHLHIFCYSCKSEQTFLMIKPTYYDAQNFNERDLSASPHSINLFEIGGRVVRTDFLCAACQKYKRSFLLRFDENLSFVMKVGQYPEWEISISKDLSKILGVHKENYQKGLICESQGYGIGAYAYYRRIIEEIIDQLLGSIQDLLPENEKDTYQKALEKSKKSIVAQDKIALVKDLLPASLRPNNANPLNILHSTLSEGIHAKTDEECLEIAGYIREILVYLVNHVIQAKESAKQFTDSMKKLLDKQAAMS